MPSEKRKKFDGKMYRVSNLKEGPYKKSLVKNLMKARRDVGTALKKKDKTLERKARNRVHMYKKKLSYHFVQCVWLRLVWIYYFVYFLL